MAKILPIEFETERYIITHFTTEEEVNSLLVTENLITDQTETDVKLGRNFDWPRLALLTTRLLQIKA